MYALSNYDLFGKANVLSRGIVGDLKGQRVVATSLYKQHFNLQTGVSLLVYASRLNDARVQLNLPR